MFSAAKIVVIGDVMLDENLSGSVHRLTPDAPVPVLTRKELIQSPGGAGNIAAATAALGAEVVLCSVVGEDHNAVILKNVLKSAGVTPVLLPGEGPTTTKTTVSGISGGGERQKLLRLDIEESTLVTEAVRENILARLDTLLPEIDFVILSDYAKGVCSPELCKAVIERSTRAGVPVGVDPKGTDWEKYRGATLIKPNRFELEAAAFALQEVKGEKSGAVDGSWKSICRSLQQHFGIDTILHTRDAEGVCLFTAGEEVLVPAKAPQVVDVIGAGDATLAAAVMARLKGMTAREVAQIAVAAGSLAVGRPARQQVRASELARYLQRDDQGGSARSREALLEALKLYRSRGMSIVFTNGCFDVLHGGHIRHFRQAKALGDVLIVAINSDDSVRRIKGEGRPLLPLDDRLSVLSALQSVDHVITFDEDTPVELLDVVRPDVLVKGANTAEVVGAEFAREVIILPMQDDTAEFVAKVANL